MRSIEKIGKLIGLCICIAYFLFFKGNEIVEWALIAGVILSIGIPHGAIDHLLADPKIDNGGLKRFVMKYLAVIGIYLLVWFLFPILALVAFLAMSAFHFGQSHYIGIQMKVLGGVIYLATGVFYLSVIFWSDFGQTAEILSAVLNVEKLESYSTLIISTSFLLTNLLGFYNLGRKWLQFSFEMILVGFLLFQLPVLVGFAVYFGFWHALPSITEEYSYLKGYLESNTMGNFIKKLLPFSLMSFLGIGLILLIFIPRLDTNQLTLVFFIMISLISAPHIWYMNKFLDARKN